MSALSGIGACVFDAYGTLFDVASATARSADVLGKAATPLATLWRDRQLQYSWLRSLQGRYADFRQVTADALDYALAALHVEDAALRQRLLGLYDTLAPYPEVPLVLERLAGAGMRMAILSNGAPDMLAPLVAQPGIAGRMSLVLSVDEVGVFKPDRRVYQLAVDRLGIGAGEICFFSSNGWDAWAASAFGFRVVWCNRTSAPPERLPGHPDAMVATLDQALPLLL